jgi:pyridoxamine 5'-phosphate oxidase
MSIPWLDFDLDQTENQCWRSLAGGAKDRRSPWHTVVLSTVHGAEPRLRTVVLRRVDVAEKQVYAHVDVRSQKASDLSLNPSTSWLAYDPIERVQIRLSGTSTIHRGDDLTRQHWEATGHHSRRFYMRPREGQPLEGPQQLQEELRDFRYTDADTEIAYGDFAVIRCEVNFMDIYMLHHEGNRRAEFHYEMGRSIKQQWMSA